MILKIIAVIVLAVAVLLIYAATRPDSFRIQRTADIKAPPEKIYAMIDDFQAWAAWSPYEKLDPTMRKTFDGAPSGKGAIYSWEGNGKAGAGRMEIADTAAPNRVTIKLDFSRPFVAHNIAEFTLEPNGDTTRVTWAMSGPSPFISKLMGIFFNMDQMIGKDFAAGLASLKTITEQ